MQITPATAKEIERLSGGTTFKLEDLSDPELNIRYGTFYLRQLLDRYGGNEVAALAAYNAGPGNADKWGGGLADARRHPAGPRPAPTSPRCSKSARTTAKSTRRSWATERRGAPRPARPRALALAVGLVLADSSVVVLALPQIYRELDTSVAGVTWVLVSFNLVMALAAVPAALLARRVGPGRAAAVGLAIFAGAGLACGLSDQLSTLIVARCVQALGGAAAVTAALELLPATVGSERRAAAVWASRRRHRRRPRPGGRRHPHPARLLAVDLPAPGAARDRRRGADPRRRQARGGDRDRRAASWAGPVGRTCSPTSPWRWSRRRSPRRSSSSSCS